MKNAPARADKTAKNASPRAGASGRGNPPGQNAAPEQSETPRSDAKSAQGAARGRDAPSRSGVAPGYGDAPGQSDALRSGAAPGHGDARGEGVAAGDAFYPGDTPGRTATPPYAPPPQGEPLYAAPMEYTAPERDDLSGEALASERGLEDTLRPARLSEMVGQDRLRENLAVFVEAAAQRGESLDHLLFYGPPGLGKTSLARIVSREMGVAFRATSGPVLERAGDLAALLSNLERGDVLFIDEVHRLPAAVEEILYPAMEDFQIDVLVGQGPSARSIRLDLPRFTLVAATTRAGLLSSPLRDRFGWSARLDYYPPEELARVLARSARLMETPLETSAAEEIARRSRGTPRIANRLLRRVRDFAAVRGEDGVGGGPSAPVDLKLAHYALERLDVDEAGFDKLDRVLLGTLIEKFDGGPVGLDTLAAAIGEDRGTLEDLVEPFLLQRGYLDRTPRGRVATRRAYQHFGRA